MIGKNFYTVKPKNLEHLTVVQKTFEWKSKNSK